MSAMVVAALAVGVPAAANGSSKGASSAEHAKARATAVSQTAREPKHLQAKVTIVMGENSGGMYFATSSGKPGGPFTLPAGKTVGIKVVNRGKLEHEILFGRSHNATSGEYRQNLFTSLSADLFSFKPVKMEIGGATFEEIEVEPGGEVWIRAVFPTKLKGKWEVGCLLEGHREAGMHASLLIR
jgi:uncharacterized cupredoxin-like copper-binding protein